MWEGYVRRVLDVWHRLLILEFVSFSSHDIRFKFRQPGCFLVLLLAATKHEGVEV